MKYYSYDVYGYYVGWGFADESPLEPGVYAVPAQATLVEPPEIADNERLKWTGSEWTVEAVPSNELPLEALAEIKRNELRNACSDAIVRSSFQSEALGAIYNYDCRLVDQINLKTRYDIALFTSTSEPVWASDGTRYQWKNHTSSELMQVMVDMNNHIKITQVKLASKLAAVDAATTKAQIEAIFW